MSRQNITDQIKDTFQDHDRKYGPVKLCQFRDGRWFLQQQGNLYEMTEQQAQAWLHQRGITPNY